MKVLIIPPLCRQNPVTVLAAVVSERAGTKVDIMPCFTRLRTSKWIYIKMHIALGANKIYVFRIDRRRLVANVNWTLHPTPGEEDLAGKRRESALIYYQQ